LYVRARLRLEWGKPFSMALQAIHGIALVGISLLALTGHLPLALAAWWF
jgi:hypothetical protein